MNTMHIRGAAAAVLVALSAAPAFAHTGLGHAAGLMHGLTHPVSGIDHILAMVAVGLLAARLGGKALWLVPLSFMTMMAVGGLAGFSGIGLPYAELGIAASVLVLGGLIALQVSLPTAVAIGLAAFFAIFHGYAHGAEVPADASGASYILGFITATGVLHLTGIGLGLAASKFLSSSVASRMAGGAIALAGAALVSGAL